MCFVNSAFLFAPAALELSFNSLFMRRYTMFGPPFSMDKAYKKVESSHGAEDILKKEHGFILRSGLEALEYVKSINAGKDARAAIYGSMVEMSIESFQDQTVQDLLNRRKQTYIDKRHHLQVFFVDS